MLSTISTALSRGRRLVLRSSRICYQHLLAEIKTSTWVYFAQLKQVRKTLLYLLMQPFEISRPNRAI